MQTLDIERGAKGTVIPANKLGPGPISDPEDNDLPEQIHPVQLFAAGWQHPNHLVRLSPS